MKICTQCGRHFNKNSRNNRCSTCRAKDQRKKNREKVYTFLGNKCVICGYDKCHEAFDIHHLYNKEFQMSDKWHYGEDLLMEEAKKCVLLCSNCHRELHAGVVELRYRQQT